MARSILAVFAGFISITVLSLGTDQVLHTLHVYPAWSQSMNDPGLNLLALSYRMTYGILGSFIAAKLAPQKPMKHAMILGGIGFVLSGIGIFVATQANLGPLWYPVLLWATTLPCAWVGGKLAVRP